MPFTAARVGDITLHGGGIAGPGCLTVLIGGKPAACVGDVQVCPMVDVLKPHAAGPIVKGCLTVLIGRRPAARLGDVTQCVGPPGAIALGSFTVVIGL
jgi:uncharacterized Zn-binding protein involved in type VI secretion